MLRSLITRSVGSGFGYSNRYYTVSLRLCGLRYFDFNRGDYIFPQLADGDLEEHITHGSGPGGQKVNKALNCVILKHKPTGLIVRCHEHRELPKNRDLARQKLIFKLDDYLHGEDSFQNARERNRQERKREMKIKRKQKIEMVKMARNEMDS